MWQSKVKILFCISPALKRQDLYRGAFLQVLSKEPLLIRDLGWQFWIRATRGSNIFCNGKCIPVLSTATFSLDFHQHQQNHDFVFSTSHSIANFGFWSFTLKISETLNNNIQGWLLFVATTNLTNYPLSLLSNILDTTLIIALNIKYDNQIHQIHQNHQIH